MFSHAWKLAAVIVPSLAATASVVQAFERSGSTLYSGVFHLAPGQTAQINVGNLGGPDTMPSCSVQLSFYGAGRRLVRAQTRTLASGAVASLSVRYADLAALASDDAATGRKPLLGEIKGFNPQPDPPGCVATMEVFNAGGGVSTAVGNPEIVPGPQR